MSKRTLFIAGAAILTLAVILLQIPAIHQRAAWRYEVAKTYLRNILNPVGDVPTAIPNPTDVVTSTPVSITETDVPAAEDGRATTPSSTPEPLPLSAFLPSPDYEKQRPNNCGPAALAMMLRMYGWDGTQLDISEIIKPVNGDRNVNPEEMAYWVRNYAGWLRIEYRVGGDLETLKRLLAAGYPVIIEGTTSLNPEDSGWVNDDLWAAHYLLLTGYDDTTRTFTAQDPYRGPDKAVEYERLLAEWKPFNYLYMFIYLPQEEDELRGLLGSNWDPNLNRQISLAASEAAAANDPSDAFAWFNLGSNLVYFERYAEANTAYDKARELGLPQRMFRYQFGPFIANFHTQRTDDLLALTEYALQRTDMSEEAWLWHGWALYRKGEGAKAIEAWRRALSIHPGYADALYALGFVGASP
ncbi:MAG: C39 family peptidase [Chloroflexi bacterium]|nr:C39 family peptidase [Chloroflexota bacterium]